MTAIHSHVGLRAIADELARSGVRHVATAPGSRSTPIVLALAGEPRLRCWSHVDERCAGFFALGVAKASGVPAVVVCTSGTAAANLLPAVIEAREARLPLVVMTADRPPERRDAGAGQTIDQLKLYGDAVRWFFEVGNHDESTPVAWWRRLGCRAVQAATEGPGPVHLNVPLREPLVPPDDVPPPAPGRPDGQPWAAAATARAAAAPEALAAAVAGRSRGVLVAGRSEPAGSLPAVLASVAEAAGMPLLADPLSGARRGAAAIAHYDALLRDPAFAARRADLVLRVGDLPTSGPLRSWLAGLDDATHVLFDPGGAWQDPDALADVRLVADPAATLAAFAPDPGGEPGWLAGWRAADAAAGAALASALGEELSEPAVALETARALGAEATLVVAASMPIRDVEAFLPVRDDAPRVLSNRGANGIDGTTSTAFGVAAAASGPVVLLTGDVALVHDLGGLLAARRLGLSLTLVVVNNDGGGIFEFLPVAGAGDVFERHVATPHGLDLAAAAALFGLGHERVQTRAALRDAVARSVAAGGATILEARTDRRANVALHRRAWAAVTAASPADATVRAP